MFKRMYLEITNVCNLRCAFCPGTQRPRRFMTPEEFRQLATRLRPYGTYLMLHVMGAAAASPVGGAAGYRRGAGLSGVPCDQRHAASPGSCPHWRVPRPCTSSVSPSTASRETDGRMPQPRIWRVSGRRRSGSAAGASCAPCGCGTAADWTGATKRSCPFSRKSWAGT